MRFWRRPLSWPNLLAREQERCRPQPAAVLSTHRDASSPLITDPVENSHIVKSDPRESLLHPAYRREHGRIEVGDDVAFIVEYDRRYSFESWDVVVLGFQKEPCVGRAGAGNP